MKTLLLLFVTMIAWHSNAQSKKEIIDELQKQQTVHLKMIDSLKQLNSETNTSYKKLMEKMVESEEKVTKLNFETSDLRMTMYEYVATIDSLTKATEQQERNNRQLKKKYDECANKKVTVQSIDENAASNRKVLNNVHLININVSETTRVKFKLIINGAGDILVIENVADYTTTTDSELLKRLLDAVKQQVKYSPGQGKETVYYTFVIQPN